MPEHVLQLCVFATGLAGIVAEYVLSTLASYLMGNTIVQWTLTISFMLFAMGVGSRVTRSLRGSLAGAFVGIEMLLSLVVSVAVPVSYCFCAAPEMLPYVIYTFSASVGLLIGMEIPIVARINSEYQELSLNLSNVLEKDYLGALLGGILFAFYGLPKLGLTYTPLVLGTLNYFVSLVFIVYFRKHINFRLWAAVAVGVAIFLALMFIFIKPIVTWGEQKRYKDVVIFEKQTAYQKIIMTRWHNDIWLYLDGHEQFSSYDEARYHEALVHPVMLAAGSRKNVMVMGGGDGLAVREILKYPDVESVTLVDIDKEMTKLAATNADLLRLNKGSLMDKRVRVVNDDAYGYILRSKRKWDVIIIDLCDPRSTDLERLYTVQFYEICRRRLAAGGALVTQSTSPLLSKNAFWCIFKTMQAAGFMTYGWHTHLATMGEWGWIMGREPGQEGEGGEFVKTLAVRAGRLLPKTEFLTPEVMGAMFVFSPADEVDMSKLKVNTELNPVLKDYYTHGDWALF